jgi:hypothetical protein
MSEIRRFVLKYVFYLLMSPLKSVKEYDAERLVRNLCSSDDSRSYPSSGSSHQVSSEKLQAVLETLT